jgi:hypothetical protein
MTVENEWRKSEQKGKSYAICGDRDCRRLFHCDCEGDAVGVLSDTEILEKAKTLTSFTRIKPGKTRVMALPEDHEYVILALELAPILARRVIELEERVHKLRATIMEKIEMEQEEQP